MNFFIFLHFGDFKRQNPCGETALILRSVGGLRNPLTHYFALDFAAKMIHTMNHLKEK